MLPSISDYFLDETILMVFSCFFKGLDGRVRGYLCNKLEKLPKRKEFINYHDVKIKIITRKNGSESILVGRRQSYLYFNKLIINSILNVDFLSTPNNTPNSRA